MMEQTYHSALGYNPKSNPAWFDFHLKVFRAKATTATLTISDWASDPSTGSGQAEPGGPIGQELIYNFIEVMPYLED